MCARRQFRLGIGLSAEKLASTILELQQGPPALALVLDDPDDPTGWARLSAEGDGQEGRSQIVGWALQTGYPHEESPASALVRHRVPAPSGLVVTGWQPGIYTCFTMPPDVSPIVLASFILDLMAHIVNVPDVRRLRAVLEQ